MRFTDKVQFYSSGGGYDPETGTSGEPEKIGEAVVNVTHLGAERSMKLFGDIDVERYVIRLLQPFDKSWATLTINGGEKHFASQTAIRPLKIDGYIVGETNE